MPRPGRAPARRLVVLALLSLTPACDGCRAEAPAPPPAAAAPAARALPSPEPPPLHDPGSEPWVPVPEDRVREECGLDPALLAAADEALDASWAVVRHGRLCHSFRTEGEEPSEARSTTKTLGALVAGMIAYQTRALPRAGPKTGPFSDEDRVDHWLDAHEYAADARVAHVLAMVGGGESVAYGERTMVYDTIGFAQINSLEDMLNAALAQDPERLGADVGEFTRRHLFAPLGARDSTWRGTNFAYTWQSTTLDMARVGLLMLNGGAWSGERLVEGEWIYRMTHPAFEDANTGYGYLTWLTAASNYTFGQIRSGRRQHEPPPCMPPAIYDRHPHGLSEAPDCNYEPPASCAQRYDAGVWHAVGYEGHLIQGHPGLDLVLVVRELTPLQPGIRATLRLWEAVRPAVVAADPVFAGDERAFCEAYAAGDYAPHLRPRR